MGMNWILMGYNKQLLRPTSPSWRHGEMSIGWWQMSWQMVPAVGWELLNRAFGIVISPSYLNKPLQTGSAYPHSHAQIFHEVSLLVTAPHWFMPHSCDSSEFSSVGTSASQPQLLVFFYLHLQMSVPSDHNFPYPAFHPLNMAAQFGGQIKVSVNELR